MDATAAEARDSKEAISTLVSGSSPPPYEATAYPKIQQSRRLRKLSSLRLRVALLLALSLSSWMCFRKGLLGAYLPNATTLSTLEEKRFQSGLSSCAAIRKVPPSRVEAKGRRENPRWNPTSGQNQTVILRNATLFDGESFLDEPVDITFSKGLIVSVAALGPAAASLIPADDGGAREIDLLGAYVTPGLVDMHSHHMVGVWPSLESVSDDNEMHPDFGPLTPFVRALDGMKAYDGAIKLIASGGVTSSLVIPGSSNISKRLQENSLLFPFIAGPFNYFSFCVWSSGRRV